MIPLCQGRFIRRSYLITHLRKIHCFDRRKAIETALKAELSFVIPLSPKEPTTTSTPLYQPELEDISDDDFPDEYQPNTHSNEYQPDDSELQPEIVKSPSVCTSPSQSIDSAVPEEIFNDVDFWTELEDYLIQPENDVTPSHSDFETSPSDNTSEVCNEIPASTAAEFDDYQPEPSSYNQEQYDSVKYTSIQLTINKTEHMKDGEVVSVSRSSSIGLSDNLSVNDVSENMGQLFDYIHSEFVEYANHYHDNQSDQ